MTFLKDDAIWRSVLTILLTAIIGICGWGLIEIVAMPKTYVTIVTFNERKTELSEQLNELKNDMNNKIESIKTDIRMDVKDGQAILRERLILNYNKLEGKIDHISDMIVAHMTSTDKKGKK